MHHLHDPLRSRRVESAAAMERRARAGTAKEKKGTKGTIIPGAAPVPEIVQIWTMAIGHFRVQRISAAALGCVWLTWERAYERASLSSPYNGECARTDQRVRRSGRGHYC